MAQAMPWWIAVYVPRGAERGANDIFKITRVDRFQATDKEIAFLRANIKTDWKLVSLASEVMVVY